MLMANSADIAAEPDIPTLAEGLVVQIRYIQDTHQAFL